MRKSKVLSKIRSSQAAKVAVLGHYLPFFVRYAAHFGYDAIWLDLEHRTMDDREVQSLLAFCHMFDIDCMLRPPSIERNRLYRYLEDGASGFLIPFASDKATAEKVVEGAKFPPLGNRGLDGAGLDGDFGLQAWAENSSYIRDSNDETFVVAQVETPGAVSLADQIAAVPGIDALFVGPADLGLRLTANPTPDVTNVESAIQQVAAAARRQGKAWGAATGSVDDIRRNRQMGAQIIPWGGEFGICQVLADCSAAWDAAVRD
jgi:2-keto-3-deoxy-L-rhamnonate aldolase RhmA